MVTARVAAGMLAKEAKRGKVTVLFGNERTGLTNEELAQAHACVAIPTAGQGTLCRRNLISGGTGPTSRTVASRRRARVRDVHGGGCGERVGTQGTGTGTGSARPKGSTRGASTSRPRSS